MKRTVAAHLELQLSAEADLILSIAVARPTSPSVETLTVTRGSQSFELDELVDRRGTRLHTATIGAGALTIDYRAEVDDLPAPGDVDPLDLIEYLRPSRYCQSDSLLPTARGEFAGLSGVVLLDAVTEWVAEHLSYVPGSSLPTDGATRTLMARQGVCRDYAHLVIALLRALDVPARMAAVYAPGLSPMDFHAVAEAYVAGAWHVVDATRLAPRESLIRIATGRDAADTAFLTNHRSDLELRRLEVLAIADELPVDEPHMLVRLA
jgi:transglutaminase-like putative cysteine protease